MERLINSRIGLTLAISLARATPPWLGYRIASLVARWISTRRNSGPVRAVRSNQWVVAGEPGSKEILDQYVRAVFQNTALSIYELYHYLQDPQKAGKLFIFEPSFQQLINRPEFDQRGLVVAGLHLSSFDLALQWFCMNWIKLYVLTIPSPEGGRQMEMEIRKRTGMQLMPTSVPVFRQAIRRLKEGGIAVTGIDHPVPQCEPRPRFFGRPASLPVHHVYLALKAQVPVVIVASRMEEDGKYHVIASPPIEMEPSLDRTQELLYNAEKVLAVAENIIRQSPQQWVMSHPVWPETVDQVPS